jgi:predicted nucleic acid-binding Zn ribbon protein
MGAPPSGPCPECGGELKRVYGRVGVRFSGWGFKKTDSLVPDDRPRKDFRALRDKAEEIAESSS